MARRLIVVNEILDVIYQKCGVYYNVVILFLTNQCSLSSSYCDASSGAFEDRGTYLCLLFAPAA